MATMTEHLRRGRRRRRPHKRFAGGSTWRGRRGYLAALGAADDDEPVLTLPDLAGFDLGRFHGLGDDATPTTMFGHKKPTRQGVTGVEAIDTLIFDVEDAVADLKMYANITTVASVFGTLGVAYLVYKAAGR